MNTLQQLEADALAKLTAERPVPPFQPGDTVRVSLRVVEHLCGELGVPFAEASFVPEDDPRKKELAALAERCGDRELARPPQAE